MNRERNDVLCDLCKAAHMDALVTFETHSLDLCEPHMRKHFDRDTCRLVPVKREPTDWELMDEKFTETVKAAAEMLRKKEKGGEQEGAGQSS